MGRAGWRSTGQLMGTKAAPPATTPGMAARIAALASAMLDSRVPLAVGRTERTATPAQRRVLAARDKGCIIPGCGVAAEACQVHHVTEWSAGGCNGSRESGPRLLGTSSAG